MLRKETVNAATLELLKKENRELRDKIMAGIKKAVDKLIETSAANNEDLIIEDEDGKVKAVPAKKLLRSH